MEAYRIEKRVTANGAVDGEELRFSESPSANDGF